MEDTLTRTPQKATERISDEELAKGFAAVINKHGLEIESHTPDFLLAEYLVACLKAFNSGIQTVRNGTDVLTTVASRS